MPLHLSVNYGHPPAVQTSGEVQHHLLKQGPYIQLEEAIKSSTNLSFNCSDEGTKPKLQHGDPSVDIQGCGPGAFKKKSFLHPQQSPLRTTGWMTASPR